MVGDRCRLRDKVVNDTKLKKEEPKKKLTMTPLRKVPPFLLRATTNLKQSLHMSWGDQFIRTT